MFYLCWNTCICVTYIFMKESIYLYSNLDNFCQTLFHLKKFCDITMYIVSDLFMNGVPINIIIQVCVSFLKHKCRYTFEFIFNLNIIISFFQESPSTPGNESPTSSQPDTSGVRYRGSNQSVPQQSASQPAVHPNMFSPFRYIKFVPFIKRLNSYLRGTFHRFYSMLIIFHKSFCIVCPSVSV